MDFNTFKQLILSADSKGTLITQKHDPNMVTTINLPFRTVVSKNVADNLIQFINSEDYSVNEYYNANYPSSPSYYTITPNPTSQFSIASSGVTGNIATSALDTLVIVSGKTSGIHMYGNSSIAIQQDINNGTLTNQRKLK